MTDALLVPEIATPSDPASGKVKIYAKYDHKVYRKDSTGTEAELGGGAGSNHNLLDGSVHPDTLAGSVASGDILYGNTTPKWARLLKGADGKVLTMVSGAPAWADPTGGSGSAKSNRYVTLLLHCEGANGSTVLRDELNHAFRAEGHAHISTDQAKFGLSSLKFDGNGDDRFYACMDNDWDLAAIDFTIECQAYFVGWASVANFLFGWVTLYSGRSWALFRDSSGNLVLYYTTAGSNDLTVYTPCAMNLNQWYHLAITRTGGKVYFFRDGTLLNAGGTANTDVFYNMMNTVFCPLTIGKFGDYASSTHAHNGYIDEIRISKGIARWTDSFTPPSAPYADPLDSW